MLKLYDQTFASRLLLGTALYPSPKIMQDAIRASGTDIVTVSLRRETAGGKTGDAFWSLIRELGVTVLPNTAGCRTAQDAITTAQLARELFATSRIKLEVIADDETLQPDLVGLVEAASVLIKDGFEVMARVPSPQNRFQKKSSVRVKALTHGKEKIVLCTSSSRAAKDRAIREKQEGRFLADLQRLAGRIASGRLKRDELEPVQGPDRIAGLRLFLWHQLRLSDESGRWDRLAVRISA